mgnify:CR=1 FL=1
MMRTAASWLERNAAQFGTSDNLPGAFHREALARSITRAGLKVAITNRFGQVHTGRTVMSSRGGGWVLNMGGAHGMPSLADETNVVWVEGTPDLHGGCLTVRKERANKPA